MKEIAQLGWKLMKDVLDAKRKEKRKNVILRYLVKGIATNHKELIKASLYRYLSEVNYKTNPTKILKEIYSFLPIPDYRAACVIVKDVFSMHNVPTKTNNKEKIQQTYQTLEKKIREGMIYSFFGSPATERDEEIAQKNLREAILKSKSADDPELARAIRTYIFVKLNRELQRPDLKPKPDKAIEKFTSELLSKSLVEHVFQTASKIYEDLALSGQKNECVRLIADLLDFIGKDPKRAAIVNKILFKHVSMGRKVDLLQKCIELG